MPKFADLADRYLEWMAHLAPTTQDGRRALSRTASSKRPEGALRAYFGRMPVGEIRKPLLLEWWAAKVEGNVLGTLRSYGTREVDLSGVLKSLTADVAGVPGTADLWNPDPLINPVEIWPENLA